MRHRAHTCWRWPKSFLTWFSQARLDVSRTRLLRWKMRLRHIAPLRRARLLAPPCWCRETKRLGDDVIMDLHSIDAHGRGADDYLFGRGPAWFALVMTLGLMIFDYVDRQVIVSLFPHLKADWGPSDKELGGLVSVVSVTVALGSIPVALFADRASRVKSIVVMAGIWSLATISCMFTGNYGQLLAARSVGGIGSRRYAGWPDRCEVGLARGLRGGWIPGSRACITLSKSARLSNRGVNSRAGAGHALVCGYTTSHRESTLPLAAHIAVGLYRRCGSTDRGLRGLVVAAEFS